MASWLENVDLAFADKKFGADNVNRALKEPRTYLEPFPVFDRALRLTATFRRASPEQVGASAAQVSVRIEDGKLEITCSCSRGRPFLCEHVVALLVDVAIHPSLRRALVEHASVAKTLDELPALRATAYEARTLDERIVRWLSPKELEEKIEMDLEVVASSGIAAGDDRPALVLRHRRIGSRTPIPPKELLATRLPASLRRKIELTTPSAFFKNALIAVRAQASLLLHLFAAEGSVRKHDAKERIWFSKTEVRPKAVPREERLVAEWWTTAGAKICDASEALLFAGPFPYLYSLRENAFHPVASDVDLDVAWGLSLVPSLPLSPALAERVGRTLLGKSRPQGLELPPRSTFGLLSVDRPSFLLRLRGTPLELTGELIARYGSVDVTIEAGRDDAEFDGRDPSDEEAATELLRAAGLVDEDREIRASEDRAVFFWESGLALLRASSEPLIEVQLAESIARTNVGPPVRVQVHVGVVSGWLDTELDFTMRALKVEIADLHRAIATHRRWLALSDGTIARITDEVAALVRESSALFGGRDRAQITPHQLGRVEEWVDTFGGTFDERANELRTRLRSLVLSPPRIPKGLDATLRPYQEAGLAWLQFLSELGAGGILADDMGLGKTITTLAFLAEWKDRGGREPALVVCPTSVIDNWAREADRFTKGLRVLNLHGRKGKDFRKAIEEADLVLTTYALLRRDIETLETIRFRCAVLDEAQYIKNSDADVTKAALRLDAGMKLALSGTPIENRLSELWSLMNFANPGLFGLWSDFEERFARPIEARPDGEVAKRLQRLLRPFVLRRTKRQVLTELPKKTEIERACLLGTKQKRLYDALAITLRQAVKKNIEKRGLARSRISVLTAILRLRQMACDPRLVDPAREAGESAKREVFLDTVRELAASGRRALVFSQFVELFTLWREDLEREGIGYEYLDGASTDRKAIVTRFQEGTAPLFLVSLKAGGVGLNLTAADTVILCDPWWNPAVEDQAAGRAHRIGQTQPVTVIRLIAAGTIEEKIGELKGKKRELASLLEVDPRVAEEGHVDERSEGVTDAVAGLSLSEIEQLLSSFERSTESLGSVEVRKSGSRAEARGENDRAPLTVLEIDDVREVLKQLIGSGLEKREVARRVGIPHSRLSLLLIGHRVPMTRLTQHRVRALHEERWSTGG